MNKKIIAKKTSRIYYIIFCAIILLCGVLCINNTNKKIYATEQNITASQINLYLQNNNTNIYECTLSENQNVIIDLAGQKIFGGICFVGQGNATIKDSAGNGEIDTSNKNVFALDIGENCKVSFQNANVVAGSKGALNLQTGSQFEIVSGKINGSVFVKGTLNVFGGTIVLSNFDLIKIDGGIINQTNGTIYHQKRATVYLIGGQYNLSGGSLASYKTTALMMTGGKFVQTGGSVMGTSGVAVSVSDGEYLLSGGEVKSNYYSAITLLSGTIKLSQSPTISSYGTYCDIYKSSGNIDASGYAGQQLLIAGSIADGEVVVSNVQDESKFVDANSYGWLEYNAQQKTLVMQRYKIHMPTILDVKQNNGMISFTTNCDTKIQQVQWYCDDEKLAGVTHNNFKPQMAGDYVVKVAVKENNVSGFGETTFELTSDIFVVQLEKIQTKTLPTKTQYVHGDLFDTAELALEATLNTGYKYNLRKQDYIICYQNGEYIKYGDSYVVIKSVANQTITEKISVLTTKKAIDLPTNWQEYYTGENFSLTLSTSEWFDVETNEKMIDAGEYQLVLKLVDNQNTFWNVQNQTTDNQTVIFKVVQAQNSIKNFVLANWQSGDTPTPPTATADFGEIEFLYSTEKDGEYTKQMPTSAGKYYAKAVVYQTNNYEGAESVIEFEITQNPLFVVLIAVGIIVVMIGILFVSFVVYFRHKKLKIR